MNIRIAARLTVCISILSLLVLYPRHSASADKIVLKNNKVIYGKVEKRLGDTVWVNIGPGAMGYNIDKISFIYNDDGSVSKYSPKSEQEIIEELQSGLVSELAELKRLPSYGRIESDELTSEEIKDFYFKYASREIPRGYLEVCEKILKKLNLVPYDFSYYDSFKEIAMRDVGGFYDYNDKKLYISKSISQKQRPYIVAHEAIHALQDQNFKLSDIVPRGIGNSDLRMARTSLVEGDAEITVHAYLFKSMGQDIKNIPDISNLVREGIEINFKNNKAFEKYSMFLQGQAMFPYLQGGSFVHKILQNYSYDKLNEIFKDPPDSTEQILHIEKYLFHKDNPVYITFNGPDNFLPGWEKVYTDRWGEYAIYSFLKEHHEILFAKAASEGWGGDELTGYENKQTGNMLLIWSTVWDTESDAEQFFGAYTGTVDKRYTTAQKDNEMSKPTELFFNCGDKEKLYIGKSQKRVLVVEGVEPASPPELIPSIWQHIEIENR